MATAGARVCVAVDIDATPVAVWRAVEPIERHVDWMVDAETITFETERTRGVGTGFVCVTRVGPIRLRDHMEITEWTALHPGSDPGCNAVGRMGVRHTGIVTGVGEFTIAPSDATGARTRFTWTESLAFPWYLGGPVGAWVAARLVLGPIWRRNLRALKRIVEAGSPAG